MHPNAMMAANPGGRQLNREVDLFPIHILAPEKLVSRDRFVWSSRPAPVRSFIVWYTKVVQTVSYIQIVKVHTVSFTPLAIFAEQSNARAYVGISVCLLKENSEHT